MDSASIEVQSKSIEGEFNSILLVGPLPPPLTGSPVSFQIFCDELKRCGGFNEVFIIDASPRRLKQGTGSGFSLSFLNIKQAIRIYVPFLSKIARSDVVLLFGSNGFVLSMGPLLTVTAKLFRKRCFFRPFGGSLDEFCKQRNSVLRRFIFAGLRLYDGIIVETKLLNNYFSDMLGAGKIHYAPGYRPMQSDDSNRNVVESYDRPRGIRLAFLGIVKPEKGIFLLLDSLKEIEGKFPVYCDIYGPIHEPERGRFELLINEVNCAQYCGIVSSDKVISKLRAYDALVLPTYYQGEGHPGVIIEAMSAGIPVITTRFRSIPEIAIDEYNALLVEPEDVESLKEAIVRLISDDGLLDKLSKNSASMSREFDVRVVVPMIETVLKKTAV